MSIYTKDSFSTFAHIRYKNRCTHQVTSHGKQAHARSLATCRTQLLKHSTRAANQYGEQPEGVLHTMLRAWRVRRALVPLTDKARYSQQVFD
jgi:hypothetical protein